ncbi:hypothetical protein SAMN04487897_11715 [Paenibacillus sp. yr247]|uniref:hypothetical protein n=1 Tax=Paenibacillus sp. yr247 TaxID=1761880 RepID=UPI00087F03C8|nr:hypothetical protein [Paenibacillus sp. yr247]SDO57235.1 hypothetical protein SAMN04487897_11715 [Paenibacillus sp. yr247]
MLNNIDADLIKLKEALDPMLNATSKNYRKVGNERMYVPLFFYYPLDQLLTIITFGKYGMHFTKIQAFAFPLLVGTPYLSTFDSIKSRVGHYEWWQLMIGGLFLWYIFTIIYSFLQMPNWKNEELFHIDAFRRWRPNEFALVDPFLDKNFSIESINSWMLRNSNERAIQEIIKKSDETIAKFADQLDGADEQIEEYEANLEMINDILVRLNDNFVHTGNQKLSYEHLYIINADYCVYEIENDIFTLKYQHYPRKMFESGFQANDSRFESENFVKCFKLGDACYYENEDAFSYKVIISEGVHWIVTYYPASGDNNALSAFLENCIIGNSKVPLKTANMYNLIESHCKIIAKRNETAMSLSNL